MGDFIGHIVPGVMCTIFGYWWFYNMLHRYFFCKRFGTPYINVSSFPLKKLCGKKLCWPAESVLKIVFSSIGIIGEVGMSCKHGRFVLGNIQHITVYGFFFLNGITDLRMSKEARKLFRNADYLTLNLAFGVEAFLFSNHFHGQTPMNVQVHTFLVFIILGCLICTFAETLYPQSVLPALGRAFCACFHGTWLIQIGFVLFMPLTKPWNQSCHKQMVWMSLSFTWHILVLFLIFVGPGYLIWRRVQNIKLPGAADGEDPEAGSITKIGGTDVAVGDGGTGKGTATDLAGNGVGTNTGVAVSGPTLQLLERSAPVHV